MNRLIQSWKVASRDLSLEIITPVVLKLKSGIKINADVLLKNFGAKNGMIIVKDYEQISSYTNQIVEEGYGFSTIDEPDENEEYIRDDYIDILCEWGWSGSENMKPSWIIC